MLARQETGISGNGFALVATLTTLMLLAVVVLGMISLSTIELRNANLANHERHAKANARLALEHAIGQLQMAMGPDRRVSASSALVSADGQRHWTGVWDTQAPDGKPWVVRDPDTGGLTDRRLSSGYQPEERVMRWLVSGSAGPTETGQDHVRLVGAGSVADPETMGVTVPAVAIATHGQRGRMAWWTGDLGQRANLAAQATGDARVAGQAAPEFIGNGPPLSADVRNRLVSEAAVAMVAGDPRWAKTHFHEFTVHSRGLLTNTRDGGIKQDLRVYFASDGTIQPAGDSPGLTDTDRLAGPANEQEALAAGLSWKQNPLRQAAPRFGVLRHWAGLSAPRDGRPLEAVLPETVAAESTEILSNFRPARLDGALKSSIQPILVEASQCHSFSWFKSTGKDSNRHHLRKHLYPKIVLWNPYSVALTTRPMMVLLQVNGRHDFWIDGYFPGAKGKPNFPVHSPWLAFDGGRSRDFVSADGSIFSSPGFNDPHMGSYYYQLEPTRFGPGECLVFTPAKAGDYRNGVKEDGGDTNLAGNVLTAGQPPHPERCLNISDLPGQPGFAFVPIGISMESTAAYFARFGMRRASNPADDLRVILKDMGSEKSVDVEGFDSLLQIAFISGSLQYGAGTEPVSPWPGSLQIPIEETTAAAPSLAPDGRTRQGLRLRTGAASPTARTEALFANWNPRAAFSLRSPRERFHAGEGRPGLKDASWGFGIYERFLPTIDSSWTDVSPTGKIGGNDTATILFDFPREGTGVISIGSLQHAKLSDLVWQPSRVIGNSLADPRIGLTSTLPAKLDEQGFTPTYLGSPPDGNRDSWAASARALLRNLPDDGEELSYDLTYEANHALWDRFFISAADPLTNPRLEPTGSPDEIDSALRDFHQAAFHLTANGAFNVNSLSVGAWAAVLAGTRIPGAKTLYLTDEEIRRLATAIVAQVKLRGPFVGMSDFVNRRLATGVTGRCGALEAAIQAAGLNSEITGKSPLLDDASTHSTPPEISTPLAIDPTLKPDSTEWGQGSFLTQADVLQVLGDSLTSRSDTFVIRAYGESLDKSGKPQARAWCEAVLQRIAAPVRVGATGGIDFGRHFRQIRFRWLTPIEI